MEISVFKTSLHKILNVQFGRKEKFLESKDLCVIVFVYQRNQTRYDNLIIFMIIRF